ncbi:MAG: DUF4332 domain-containing protein [Bacteroidales bacterium]
MTFRSLKLEDIRVDTFFEITRNRKLIPSRRALQVDMESRLQALKAGGIIHLGDLVRTLDSEKKREDFSRKHGLPPEYLTLLVREAKSYLPRPFPLEKFPGVPFEYAEILRSRGIRNTREAYEAFRSPEERDRWGRTCGIPRARMDELQALCDLSRITGVGPVFARISYLAGIRSCAEFAHTPLQEMHERFLQVLDKVSFPTGNFSRDDLEYCRIYADLIAKREGMEK